MSEFETLDDANVIAASLWLLLLKRVTQEEWRQLTGLRVCELMTAAGYFWNGEEWAKRV